MSRLIATLRLDARLQARNRVYPIVAIAAAALAGALRALFTAEQLHVFMPLVALSGVSLTTLFLIGVLLLLERGEGTLDVVLVSPLRPAEYLASKLLTVTGLALVESLLIVAVAYGPAFAPGWLLPAVALRAGLVGAIGVALGVRYRSITDFLFPAIAVTLLVDLPVLWYLGLWSSPLFYLWASLPSLLLAKAAFLPVASCELLYAGIYGCAALVAALVWAFRSLDRFVVQGEARS